MSSIVRHCGHKEGTAEDPEEGFMVTCKCPFQLYDPSPDCACEAFNGKEKSPRLLCLMTIWKGHESRVPNLDFTVGIIFKRARKKPQMAYYITSRCLASTPADEGMPFSWFIWRLWPCYRHTKEQLSTEWPCPSFSCPSRGLWASSCTLKLRCSR